MRNAIAHSVRAGQSRKRTVCLGVLPVPFVAVSSHKLLYISCNGRRNEQPKDVERGVIPLSHEGDGGPGRLSSPGDLDRVLRTLHARAPRTVRARMRNVCVSIVGRNCWISTPMSLYIYVAGFRFSKV